MSVDVSALDPIAALRSAGSGNGASAGQLRRLGLLAALLAVGIAAVLAGPRVAHVFADAFDRAIHANPLWVVAGIALEFASFAGYIALFWHVAGRATGRIGLRSSAEVALASTAATRLLPTAGAGGAALTFWSLRRAGQDNKAATRTLLTFLVLLYAVFLGSLLVAGTLLASGAASSNVSLELSAAPAAAAGVAIAVALLMAVRHGSERRSDARLSAASHAIGGAVRDAIVLVRRPDARLLGAVAWWAFDMSVLWAMFSAFGVAPSPVVLVLGYFLGQVANTAPIPGAASGGMVGAFLGLGMPAEVALPAVLAYRAIAIWTPVPAGAVALTGLRKTVRRWAVEDADGVEIEAEQPAPEPECRGARPLPARPARPAHRGTLFPAPAWGFAQATASQRDPPFRQPLAA